MVAVAHSGTGNVTAAGANSATTATVATPPNVTDGDLLVTYVGHQNGTDSTRTWTAPAGWTRATALDSAFRSLAAFTYQVADADALPATHTFGMTSGGPGRIAAICFRVTGHDTTAPIAATLGTYQGTANGTIALGTAAAGDLTLGLVYTSMPGGTYPTTTYTGGLTHLGYGGTSQAGATNTLMYASSGAGSGVVAATMTHTNGEGALLAITAAPEPEPTEPITRWGRLGSSWVPLRTHPA